MNTADPQRFLHSSEGGFTPPTRVMLPIRQNINRLTAINRTLRAVLIEVVGMAENGNHGAFTAGNDYLSDQIGGTVRTITRALAELQRLGLVVATGATKLRRVTPTEALRKIYLGTEPEQFAAVEELNRALENLKECKMSIDILGEEKPVPTDILGSVYRHSESVSIDNGGSVYRHSGSVYKETSNNQYKTTNEEVERLRSALAAAEKKIEALESEKTELTAEVQKVTTQRDQLRNSLLAQRPASHTQGAGRLMDFAASKYATEQGFQELLTKLPTHQRGAYVPHYLPLMLVKAEDLPQRDEAGWKNWIVRWLGNETALVTKAPELASSSKVQQARNGVDEAREIMRRKREGGEGNG